MHQALQFTVVMSVISCCVVAELQVGAAFMSHSVALPNGQSLKFEIWDTAGQVRCEHDALVVWCCKSLELGLSLGVAIRLCTDHLHCTDRWHLERSVTLQSGPRGAALERAWVRT